MEENSDDDFRDFKKQEFNSDGDFLDGDDDSGIPVNEDAEDMVEDSYLQSQFDFMYSEDTTMNNKKETEDTDYLDIDIHQSIHLREK